MRYRFRSMVLAVGMTIAASSFAQTKALPTGTWKGTIARDGEQAPIVLRLAQKGGLWKGRADVDGSSSPLTQVQVDDNHVRFSVKGQGTFDGTCSQDSLTGSVSGTKKKTPASFSLARYEESHEDMQAAIEAVDSGP